MPDAFRLQVLKRLTAVLEGVVPAAGYTHDLSGRVFRGRIIFGEEDPVPMISILEVPLPPDQTPSPASSGTDSATWELILQGWTVDDRQNPTDPAHQLMAEVKQVLAKARERSDDEDGCLGSEKIVSMRVGPGVVRPPDQVSIKAYFWLSLTLTMAEDNTDPFAPI